MPTQNGVIYCAAKQPDYVTLAYLSAVSLKKFCPDIPVTLFTDQPDHPLARAGVFENTVTIEPCNAYKVEWANGLFSKVHCLRHTPYQRTIFLDADSEVTDESFADLFDLLEHHDIALVPTTPETSKSAYFYGKPMFFTGVIAYAMTDIVRKFLIAFEEQLSRYFSAAEAGDWSDISIPATLAPEDAEWLLFTDQAAMAELLSPDVNTFNLNLLTLGEDWNYREETADIPATVKIDSRPGIKDAALRRCLETAHVAALDGRLEDADRLYRAALLQTHLSKVAGKDIPLNSDHPLVRAELQFKCGNTDNSVDIWRTLIGDLQISADAAFGLGRVAMQIGELEDAEDLLKAAWHAAPQLEGRALSLQACYELMGRPEQAAACLRSTLRHLKTASLWRQLGVHQMALEQYRQAGGSFKRALKLNPRDSAAQTNLIAAHLARHRYKRAETEAERALKSFPGNTAAQAWKTISSWELGLIDSYQKLTDEKLIAQIDAGTVMPADDLRTMNDELVELLVTHRTLSADPIKYSTRLGWHTENILSDIQRSPALQALAQLIRLCTEDWIRRSRGREVSLSMPTDYKLQIWGVVMGDGGHQIPHIHPSGRVSGVYYVSVPDEVHPEDPNRRGWLAFGPADDKWHRKKIKAPSRFVYPKPGLLVSFPSYFWHHTVPVRSTDRRISIAFDILPLRD